MLENNKLTTKKKSILKPESSNLHFKVGPKICERSEIYL